MARVNADGTVSVHADAANSYGANVLVTFETTLTDAQMQSLLNQGYSLKVSFIAYYGSWKDGPFIKGAVELAEDGTVIAGFDRTLTENFNGSDTNAQTLTIDFDAYYTALQAVKTGGVGDNAYAFIVSRGANNGTELKLISVELVAPVA